MSINNVWMRQLKVTLTSTTLHQSYVFGENWKQDKDDLDISISGTKYLSGLKDNFVVRIKNLTYGEVLKFLQGKFYDIKIEAGYRNTGCNTIFKGSVIFMSNQQDNKLENTLIILCGSRLIASYGQSKMNFSLSSGINMYSALKFLCKRAGIVNANINEDFRNRIIREASSVQSSTIGSYLENFASINDFIIAADSSYENDVTILDPSKNNNRVVKLDSNNAVLVNGYPKLTSDGLTMTLLPTYNLMPMDVIQLDNSLIDISVSSYDTSSFNNAMFLDEDGKYLITQLSYELTNRERSFQISLIAKARNLYTKLYSTAGG